MGGRLEHRQPARRRTASDLRGRHRQRAGDRLHHLRRTGRVRNRRPGHERRPEDGWQRGARRGVLQRHRREPAGRQRLRRAAAQQRVRPELLDRRADHEGSRVVLPQRPHAGCHALHPRHLLQRECRQRRELAVFPDSRSAAVHRSQVGEHQRPRDVAGDRQAQDRRLLGRAGGLPHVRRHDLRHHRSGAHVAGSRRV